MQITARMVLYPSAMCIYCINSSRELKPSCPNVDEIGLG